MGYEVVIIDRDRCIELKEKYSNMLFRSKADICGICVELFTDDRDHLDMWNDNFYSMSSKVRSHARLYSVKDPDPGLRVLFEPYTNTAFLINFDYYGWIKSIALGISGNILEEEHSMFSVHGAAIDVDGKGVTLIAPSKTGKTTQSWGLLALENSRLISDDWYFVRLGGKKPYFTGSERNCYVDADIGDVWEQYKPLVKNVIFDNKGRGIANIRWISGSEAVSDSAHMGEVILLKRDKDDPVRCRELITEEALEYLKKNDFCNPHQIVRDERKIALRTGFFREYLSCCRVHMINTTGTPEETQELVRKVASGN